MVEAADEREEALTIAVALREALEQPDRTAALITPDRALALRVAAELRRWNIVADDSAGEPLARSPAGRLRGSPPTSRPSTPSPSGCWRCSPIRWCASA